MVQLYSSLLLCHWWCTILVLCGSNPVGTIWSLCACTQTLRNAEPVFFKVLWFLHYQYCVLSSQNIYKNKDNIWRQILYFTQHQQFTASKQSVLLLFMSGTTQHCALDQTTDQHEVLTMKSKKDRSCFKHAQWRCYKGNVSSVLDLDRNTFTVGQKCSNTSGNQVTALGAKVNSKNV